MVGAPEQYRGQGRELGPRRSEWGKEGGREAGAIDI